MKGHRRGSHRVICDRCGFKRWSYDTRMEWTGLRVCKDTCWEPRHPQDFTAAPIDKQSVPNPRPDADPSYRTLYHWNSSTQSYEEV